MQSDINLELCVVDVGIFPITTIHLLLCKCSISSTLVNYDLIVHTEGTIILSL